MDQVIRYFVVHNFVCNFDSYTGSMIHNYYLYEKDGRLSMIPLGLQPWPSAASRIRMTPPPW